MPIHKKDYDYDISTIVLPYYVNQNPQTNYYFAVEKSGFMPNRQRTDGSYSKYASIDDKMDDLHWYTWFIKTGRGRCTDDAAIEIRNNIIDREEAISLVKKYDGEFPKTYFKDILNYLDMSEKEFKEIIDKFRPKHLWEKRVMNGLSDTLFGSKMKNKLVGTVGLSSDEILKLKKNIKILVS